MVKLGRLLYASASFIFHIVETLVSKHHQTQTHVMIVDSLLGTTSFITCFTQLVTAGSCRSTQHTETSSVYFDRKMNQENFEKDQSLLTLS